MELIPQIIITHDTSSPPRIRRKLGCMIQIFLNGSITAALLIRYFVMILYHLHRFFNGFIEVAMIADRIIGRREEDTVQ